MIGGSYSITSRWKEQVFYREGDQEYCFPAGWGVSPPVLYVPHADDWDVVTPEFLHGRRAEIVGRLERESSHVVRSDPPSHAGHGSSRDSGPAAGSTPPPR